MSTRAKTKDLAKNYKFFTCLNSWLGWAFVQDNLAVQQQSFSLILEAEEGVATVPSYTAQICHCNSASVVP